MDNPQPNQSNRTMLTFLCFFFSAYLLSGLRKNKISFNPPLIIWIKAKIIIITHLHQIGQVL